MSLMDSLKEAITQKPVNLKGPLFYKNDSDAVNQLELLKELLKTAPDKIKAQIEQDIKMLAYGIAGEENVAFELRNSYLPIIILHDLHFEYDDLTAQIDYMIITTKFTLIVECKNLIGNIEINSNGDFIRTLEFSGKYKKEGIYSPITQNMRHLQMIKKMRLDKCNNAFSRTLVEKFFNDNYKSVVVLANPKTVINMKYAKKEIKEQIIRCDQLIEYIKRLIKESTNESYAEKDMYEKADFFLSVHTPNTVDYTKRYGLDEYRLENKSSAPIETCIEDTPVYKKLRQYRYERSVAEGIKAYYIYNNAQLEELISVMPKDIEELKKVSGFGDSKCQKYGPDLLSILKEFY